MRDTPGHTSETRAAAVYRSVEEIPASFGPSVAAIGNFDGVHCGHREILSAVAREAHRRRARAVAVTFDPHPEQVLRPDRAPRLLTPLAERLRLLSETGLDAILVLPFNQVVAGWSPDEFVERVLVKALGVCGLHEGMSFRFGHRAAAGVRELKDFGSRFGFAVEVHQPVRVRGLEISSSAVRALVAAGDMRRARWMLGRPFAVLSTPARGRGIGSKLLVPTVNLAPYQGQVPAFGVYITRFGVSGRSFEAVTNVGNRPTFGEDSFAIESHILDFEPVELHDQTPLELEFLSRLRDEIKFASPAELKAQIVKDVSRAKRYFGLLGRMS
jgi:riboflavin kinase / FMN adenylyltransferase